MKRIKRLNQYSRVLVAGNEKRDREELRKVRGALSDIAAFTRGIANQIISENRRGEIFLYDRFDQSGRKYFSRLEKNVSLAYDEISAGVSARAEDIYLFYRKELTKTLKSIEFAVEVAPVKEMQNVSFGGTASASFTRHLRRQLQVGVDPAALIKTLSKEHVRMIQGAMMTAVSKGKGFNWVADKLLRDIYPDIVDRQINKTMEYNITRVARTSYMQAVNLDTSSFVRENGEVFYGSRRTADGRPCMACIAQDGDFYPPDRELVDHPNGMCILVPLPYPDEFFNNGVISKPIGDVFDQPLSQKFYMAPASEQRKLFANTLLYNLWRKEKFDIDKVVVGKFGTPISFRQAALNLDKMGGISESRVSFRSTTARNKLLKTVDPKDRLNRNIIISDRSPIGGVTSQGLDLKGSGDEFLSLRGISHAKRAKIAALYGEESNLQWYVFNQRARDLGIYTRKTSTGRRYYAVPKGSTKIQFLPPKTVYKKFGDKSWGDRFAFQPNVDDVITKFDTIAPGGKKQLIRRDKDMKKSKSSLDFYTDKDGNPLPERVAFREKIIKSFFSDENILKATPLPGQKPQYVMFGGRGGSGKSALSRKKSKGGLEVVDEDKFIVLDSDAIKEALVGPEWAKMEYEGWNAFLFHDESKLIFDEVTRIAKERKLNLVHDMTMSTKSKAIKKVDEFIDSGYDVSGFYMHLPPQTAADRALARFYTRQANFEGRLVPANVVLEMVENEAAFEALKVRFKRWAFYDNQGSGPVLLGSHGI